MELTAAVAPIPSVSTDSEIIQRSRDTPAAFGELFDRHARSLRRYAASRAGIAVADDVMSETFLIAFERRNGFDHSWDDAGPRLKTIARSGHEVADDEFFAVAGRVDAQLAIRTLAGALKSMSSVNRDTLLLWAWADLTYEQIAHATAVPIGTVRSRINRARSVLRHASKSIAELEQEKEHGRANPAAPFA
jgi:DNA-directed RNA polymerase specialized sigma24 family protein